MVMQTSQLPEDEEKGPSTKSGKVKADKDIVKDKSAVKPGATKSAAKELKGCAEQGCIGAQDEIADGHGMLQAWQLDVLVHAHQQVWTAPVRYVLCKLS
jgi:hypothetical protein